MKALVISKYRPAASVRLTEVEKPKAGDKEVLIRVRASSINFNNLGNVTGNPFIVRFWTGLGKPKIRIPGNDFAGIVEAAGKEVKNFKPGDEVFGESSACGFGAFAEYISVPENILIRKPDNLSFAEAAVVPEAGLVALQALLDIGKVKEGDEVLIYGASGGIGTFALQLAKHFGTEVTGLCSTRNLELVRSIGADHVIDYTKEDFSKNGKKYDLIVATAGYRPIIHYKKALKPNGIYVCTGGWMKQIFQALLLGSMLSEKNGRKLTMLEVVPNKDLNFLKELLESEKIKPVIDREYNFDQMADALSYYGKRHSRGKVAVVMRKL